MFDYGHSLALVTSRWHGSNGYWMSLLIVNYLGCCFAADCAPVLPGISSMGRVVARLGRVFLCSCLAQGVSLVKGRVSMALCWDWQSGQRPCLCMTWFSYRELVRSISRN